MYLSAQENIKRGRQGYADLSRGFSPLSSLVSLRFGSTIETLNRAIGDLDTVTDKQKYLEFYSSIFSMPKRIKFEPHKGDEVTAVNAQVLIRDEMQSRFIQMQNRLAALKTENDEVGGRTLNRFRCREKSRMNPRVCNSQTIDAWGSIDGIQVMMAMCETRTSRLSRASLRTLERRITLSLDKERAKYSCVLSARSSKQSKRPNSR